MLAKDAAGAACGMYCADLRCETDDNPTERIRIMLRAIEPVVMTGIGSIRMLASATPAELAGTEIKDLISEKTT
jgi:hypothetical protein